MFLIKTCVLSISDRHIVFAGLKFLLGDVNSDTMLTLTLSFHFVQDPGILEDLCSLVFKLFNGLFVYTSMFVDQVASCGGLTLIYVCNDNNADMGLFLFDAGFELAVFFVTPVF